MKQCYEITIEGVLPEAWLTWLESFEVTYDPEKKITIISVEILDQAMLFGIINRIRDLGLFLVSVHRI